ncbi:MAG: glycosyltransferase family 2 protein, partial [Alkalispirochaetaceae bacterium]
EEAVISETIKRLTAVVESAGFEDVELLFVNDGSSDRTGELLAQAAASDPDRVRVIEFSRNFGHQPAVSAGLHLCRGDVAIIMDADLQDPPELIPELVRDHESSGADVVYCVRKKRKAEGLFKRLTARGYYRFLNAMSDVYLPLDTGDFRLVSRRLIEAFRALPERNKYIRGLVSWLGFTQKPFFYDRDARAAGETKYPFGKMLRFALTGLLYFTKKPLEIGVSIGIVAVLLSIPLLAYALVSFFAPGISTVPGWTSTIIVIVFFSGVQLLTVGMVGLYVGSVFDEVKQRPEYLVKWDSAVSPEDLSQTTLPPSARIDDDAGDGRADGSAKEGR